MTVIKAEEYKKIAAANAAAREAEKAKREKK